MVNSELISYIAMYFLLILFAFPAAVGLVDALQHIGFRQAPYIHILMYVLIVVCLPFLLVFLPCVNAIEKVIDRFTRKGKAKSGEES